MRKLMLLLFMFLIANGKATLCYKQNFAKLSEIEITKLDGGECRGNKSVKDMQKEGWKIKDIQISKAKNGFNYNYVFEKQDSSIKNINLHQAIKQITKEDEKAKQIAKLKQDIKEGSRYYKKYCQECHGEKGELEPYGNSRKLNKLSLDEFKDAIRGYENHQKDNGTAMIMTGYLPINSDIEKIYKYLKEVNK